MSESNLKKEFSQRDVKRMRDLITGNIGDRTQVQVGYEKQSNDYQEGDIWEADGKKWTIKNGIKQTVTKYDTLKRLVTLPLTCPNCGRPMKDNRYNKEMWAIHKTCFDCVIEYETKLRQQGKFEEYQRNILNANKDALLDETLEAIDVGVFVFVGVTVGVFVFVGVGVLVDLLVLVCVIVTGKQIGRAHV